MDNKLSNALYFKGIDGLRGLASISVVLFHLAPAIFPLGWVGVDLFFVISGFLITQILINNRDKTSYFRTFYLRRFFRIAPIYFLVVLPIVIFLYVNNKSSLVNSFSYVLWLQNISALNSHYLAGLEHTWSLAIEEQFYLVYPLIIYLISTRNLIKVFLFLIATAIIFRIYFSYSMADFHWQSNLLITRMDSLILGGLLPLIYKKSIVRATLLNRLLYLFFSIGFFGLVLLLVWQIYRFGSEDIFTVFISRNLQNNPFGQFKYTFISLVFASLVGFIAYFNSWYVEQVISFLEIDFLKYLGKLSYGIYLYHFPILIVLKIYFDYSGLNSAGLLFILLNILVTVIVAHFSWKLIESPFLSLKRKFEY